MSKHNEIFKNIPYGRTVANRWAAQPVALLDAAAAKIATHGAEPWVFSGDARMFWQFARAPERAALRAFTADEHTALLGQWDSDEFFPESFGYEERE